MPATPRRSYADLQVASTVQRRPSRRLVSRSFRPAPPGAAVRCERGERPATGEVAREVGEGKDGIEGHCLPRWSSSLLPSLQRSATWRTGRTRRTRKCWPTDCSVCLGRPQSITQIYLHGDLSMKEAAIAPAAPPRPRGHGPWGWPAGQARAVWQRLCRDPVCRSDSPGLARERLPRRMLVKS